MRVQVRSNYHRKRAVWAILKKYVASKERKRANVKICDEHLKMTRARRLRKIMNSIRRVNHFEARWISNVRFELYFADVLQQMLD